MDFTIMGLINGVSQIASYIQNLVNQLGSIFSGVNLTDLFASYFPAPIYTALSGFLTLVIFIALIGIIKKVAFFLGG